MTEPTINRSALTVWMPISLLVAALLLWLGADLHPPGAAAARTLPAAPLTGAMGFSFLLVFAAFAYAASITTPHRMSEQVSLWAALVLPLIVVLLLRTQWSVVALLIAIVWLVMLVWTAWQLAQRQPLAGIMMLPIIGSAFASMLLSVTLWVLP